MNNKKTHKILPNPNKIIIKISTKLQKEFQI